MNQLKAVAATISLLGVSAFTQTHAHDDSAVAHYLGNEGVLVVHDDTKILFDAFYANSYGQYALVPDNLSAAMLSGDAPFDGIDAVFVSHIHGDHFSVAPALEYLRAQKDVHFYAPQQVADAFLEAGVDETDPVFARIHGHELAPDDEGRTFTVGNLEIDVVAIPHAGNRPDIQNFAWRVTLDDKKTVIHLGDAGTLTSHFERHAKHFDKKETETAFPPYWFLGDDNGAKILEEIIKVDQVIGIHVPARAAFNGDEWRTRAGGDLFTDPGETRILED